MTLNAYEAERDGEGPAQAVAPAPAKAARGGALEPPWRGKRARVFRRGRRALRPEPARSRLYRNDAPQLTPTRPISGQPHQGCRALVPVPATPPLR
jgi:hypothetical protein